MNPYSSGAAALPGQEPVARLPKISVASALLALVSILGILGTFAYVGFVLADLEAPTESQYMIVGLGLFASGLVALVGLPLGIGGLFVRRSPRTLAAIATFVNGAIVLCTLALIVAVAIEESSTP